MLLMIDNYDSFTYNLYQYLSELGADVVTIRNDKTTLEEISSMSPDGIIISPGPCTPREAGISNQVIKMFLLCLWFDFCRFFLRFICF